MSTETIADERRIRDTVQLIIDGLLDFDTEIRSRILRTVQTFYGLDSDLPGVRLARPESPYLGETPTQRPPLQGTRSGGYTERAEVSPKDFLFQKQPRTDVERVACLAFYLTHFRGQRQFKTVDISALNTEAAHTKFSNTAFSVANASNAGLLVPAGKGFKQLSALGERYVEALPDRDAAKDILSTLRVRRRRRVSSGNGKRLET